MYYLEIIITILKVITLLNYAAVVAILQGRFTIILRYITML